MKKKLCIISIIIVIALGYLFIRSSKNNKLEIRILMYHHFEDSPKKTNDVTILTEEFEKQMKYLSENGYTSITSQDLLDYKNGKKEIPKKAIFITSDDGYLSNYEKMYPILKKYNMKATIFLIGERIDNADKPSEALPKLSWKNVKEMYESGLVDFQCHTYNSHQKIETKNGLKGNFSTNLIGESEEEFKKRIDKDIKMNIDGIKQNLGYTPIAFSYPFGDISDTAVKILEENNIKLTFRAEGGIEENPSKGYLLKRIGITNQDSLQSFIKKIN